MMFEIALLELLALVFFGLAAWQAWRAKSKLQLIDATPTTPIGRITTAGYFEVKGKAVSAAPLSAPGGGARCVYYRVVNRRTVRESYRDSDGRTRTRTRTEERVTDEQLAPFHIQDRTGKLMVDPLDAEFRTVGLERVRHDTGDSWLGSWFSWNREVVTDSETRVEGIPVDRDIYAIGRVTRQQGGLYLQRDTEAGKPFILSAESEAEIAGKLASQVTMWTVGAVAALLVAMALPFVR